ncbi:OLC1v1011708C1 [Oldenlandia corymbosa var. corymbosa]|uniref:OLC1v1011708C1 n=1 Tax=Oldenlandia corymbosa var. corymbosa TaxID=529605 RepID=A0AAV1DU97_OLDCO|nr:OLC1v1011708C1 [Oldenlandia corymbosa var. corymbosa]
MADRDRPQPHQIQVHPQRGGFGDVGFKAPQRGPSASQILAVVTLLPVGGSLLALAGLTLAGSLIGLALTTPLFIICSPVLVPAAVLLGLAVTGILSSGAFGLTGLSSLSWVLSYFRQRVPESMDYAKRSLQDTAVTLGQKTKEVGEKIQTKAQEPGREQTGRETSK